MVLLELVRGRKNHSEHVSDGAGAGGSGGAATGKAHRVAHRATTSHSWRWRGSRQGSTPSWATCGWRGRWSPARWRG
ncbi:Os06g0112151 [Oryza sativa Japonica Group]|uniref:Os06g0112151 protein n=1 Tax=Oryza sativa subsp. japonica TaxID=39947 RepID=A0A0N7KLE6_ORYSJ|nr:Os06g0112151 [Oryza sativa Japonica Group]